MRTYEIQGYKTRKDFESFVFEPLGNGFSTWKGAVAFGRALCHDFYAVKVQSDDREEIEIFNSNGESLDNEELDHGPMGKGDQVMDITVTPWKPKQGIPFLLRLPEALPDKEISILVEMFLVGDIHEVRWQHGHVKPISGIPALGYNYDGNGHYVHS